MATLLASILALFATCGVPETSPDETSPDEFEPSQKTQEDQHFCCDSVDLSGQGSGDGCTAASKELINSCRAVLYCAGNWGKDGGHVKCL